MSASSSTIPMRDRIGPARLASGRAGGRLRSVTWLPVITFAVATFAFMPRALLGLGTFGPFDILEYASPWRDALATTPHVQVLVQNDFLQSYPVITAMVDALRHGHWLTWTPYVAGGEPIGAMPISGVESVFNLPLVVLPNMYGLAAVAALRLLFSQAFFYLFLRRFRVSVPFATFGAVAYTFCGTNLVLFGRITAYMMLPALMWAVARLLERRRPRDVAWLAVFGAITWLEGFPAGFANTAAISGAVAVAAALPLSRAGLRARAVGNAAGDAAEDAAGGAPDAAGVASGLPGLLSAAVIRRALTGLALVGAGFVLAIGLSAVSVLPFQRIAADSQLVSQRHYTSADHLSEAVLPAVLSVGALGSVHQPLVMLTRAPDGSGGAAGNPVELESGAGLVVVLTALAGMVLALLGRLRLSSGQKALYVYGLAATVGGLLLVYFDTPLLALFDKLPLLGQNPVNRFRIIINVGLVLLTCLGLQGFLSAMRRRGAASEGASDTDGAAAFDRAALSWLPRTRSDGALRICVGAALVALAMMMAKAWPGYWGWLSSQLATSARHKMEAEAAGATGFVLAAFGALRRAGREPARRAALLTAGVALAATAATFATVALPLHSFTPTVDTSLRDPVTPGHRLVQRLAGTQYRILGSGLGTFYSNTSLYYHYLDLRGLSMSSPGFRSLVLSALPNAYARDKFKVIYVPQEQDPVRFDSPVLNDLAVRYYVAGTDEVPFARNGGVRAPVATRSIVAGRPLVAEMGGDRRLVGVAIPVQRGRGCEGSRLTVTAAAPDGTVLGTSARPAIDALLPAPGALAFMLPQGAAPARGPVRVSLRLSGGHLCVVAAGVDASGTLVVSPLLANQPALRVLGSDQGVFYQRPHAHPIAWLSPRWRPAPTTAAALRLATAPGRRPADPVPVAGAGPSPVSPPSGRVLSLRYVTNGFDVTVRSSGRALLATGFADSAHAWSAQIDGRSARIAEVDGALLGAVVGAGVHTVSFRFHVPGLAVGLMASVISALVVVLLFVGRRPRRRVPGPSGPGGARR